MVAVQPPALVLVTGASGFLAAHACQTLLEKEFKVRGTVRSKEKGEYLVNLYKNSNFSYTIVPDIRPPNAFDEAVKGVDAVLHMASPFQVNVVDPEDLVRPAVQGTKGVLESIQTFNCVTIIPSVKRVIITSSIASITVPSEPGHVFTETDWNTLSADIVAREGINAPGMEKYRLSKVSAERAAWEFVDGQKPTWDLVTVCPLMIYRTIIHECASVERLNTSIAQLRVAFTPEGAKRGEDAGRQAGNWADVRDVAEIHTQALLQQKAGGNRFIAGGGPFSWQMMYDSVQAFGHIDGLDVDQLPKGTPGSDRNTVYMVTSNEKAKRELGIKFHLMGECVRDTLLSLKALGFF
ncbi:NADP-binding protein [Dacryopinax primogenitus]|uniref:NADP-binding protein n=1 Tax=Dacryopinax primogenitus (strain DJM 731) TaxID=1858805 RepID=M5FU01_DACPD|nr:NADP-binding protein [Dacryopinax primogenitus]EJT99638.1 NADP-binding protein [Dacryopinax primogenitus]